MNKNQSSQNYSILLNDNLQDAQRKKNKKRMFVVIFVSGVLDVNYYSINVARGAGKFVTSVS